MADLNALIAQGVQFKAPPDPFAQYAQMQQLQQGEQANQLNQMKMQEYQRNLGQQSALRGTLAGFKPDMPVDAQVAELVRGGHLTEARSLAESHAKAQKDLRDAETAQLTNIATKTKLAGQILAGATDEMSYQRALPQLAAIDPKAAASMPSTFDPAFVSREVRKGLDLEKQLEQHFQEQNLGGTVRTMTMRKFGTGPATVVPGSEAPVTATPSSEAALMNARAAQGQLALAQENANAPQYMATNEGIVALPKHPKTGAIVGSTVTGPSGEPLQKELKQIPASVNTAISTNRQSISAINDAIRMVEANPDAVGWKGYMPNKLLNETNPEGVDARAALSNIGSLKLHERSGAAITASEFPRLAPFIPLSTDDAETAVKKLKQMRKIALGEQEGLTATYSKEQGYRPNPISGGDKPAGNPHAEKTDAQIRAELGL